jgi:hypothetical protein
MVPSGEREKNARYHSKMPGSPAESIVHSVTLPVPSFGQRSGLENGRRRRSRVQPTEGLKFRLYHRRVFAFAKFEDFFLTAAVIRIGQTRSRP